MSALFQAVQDYLEMRRALGYQLTEHGRVLPQFVTFLEQRDAPLITTALAVEFATQPTQASVVWRHTRLAIVRGFAIYAQALDARHEVPPANLLPATYRRAIPYLYSDAEIDALMHAARALRPALRAATCETLIGLLSVTGMRISEACGLDRGDVDIAARRLTIRRAKNGRSREIPLHPSTVTALERYAHVRDELCPGPVDSAFFLSRTRARLSPQIARRSFDQLRRATGLDRDTLGRHARIHDIRHTYVLRTLLRWYREESDVESQLPLLSTFLGHVEPKHTFWYFEATPELLTLAAERLERTWDRSRARKDQQ
jgi:integrase